MGLELLIAAFILATVIGIAVYQQWSRSHKRNIAVLGEFRGESMMLEIPTSGSVQTVLQELKDELRVIQDNQARQQGIMEYQVEQVIDSTGKLRDETFRLKGALSNNQIRGNWGEMQLRRALELAGMLEHVDFTEQMELAGGTKRPDAVVHLPGNKHVIIDSKASMTYYLELLKEPEGPKQDELMLQHAKGLKQHINSLSTKEYWKSLPGATEFVILFMPNDPALGTAVTTDPYLLEYGMERRIILAGPSTLVAVLFALAQGWKQVIAVESANEIVALGGEMYNRVQVMSATLDEARRRAEEALKAINNVAWHASNRVYPTGRKLQALTSQPKQLLDRVVAEVEE